MSGNHPPLALGQLHRYASEEAIGFSTTKELKPLEDVINQERAMQALDFAMKMPQKGYNLYAVGPYGTGKKSLIMRWLKKNTLQAHNVYDWVYVYNFEDNNKPISLHLPAGYGPSFKNQMKQLLQDLTYTIPSIFEGHEYRARYNKIDQEYQGQQDGLFQAISEDAAKEHILIQSTETGFSVLPSDEEGKVLDSGNLKSLDIPDREKLEQKLLSYQKRLQETVSQLPLIERKRKNAFKQLEKEVVVHAVDHLVSEILVQWQDFPHILDWLNSMRQAVLDHPLVFVTDDTQEKNNADNQANNAARFDEIAPLRRFEVNVIVGHSCHIDDDNDKQYCDAPIVYCENPSLANLVGHIEYVSKYGAQLTDFNLIKAGALHHANGGTLVIDADKLLQQPLAWDALKRAINTGFITFDLVMDQATTTILASLSPQKIPLHTKIILLGNHHILSMLSAQDTDFNELFKVIADFDMDIPRTIQSEKLYGRFIALVTKEENLKPLNGQAVARVIEYGSRMAGNKNKLTAHMASIVDLLREGHQLAQKDMIVQCHHIDAAIEGRIFRNDKIRSSVQQQIKLGVLNIETEGFRVGQINGLSVLSTDRFAFGQPARITASVWLGKEGIIDIEREVDLGGSLHSKGVMILSSYLAAHFAQDFPLSLAASLTFEQSYFGVDGDSASSAEAYALLSALSDMPLNQSIAVTGALDQKGNVQAIGGVNEKIEGFFDICHARGLNGKHGVIIPKANEQDLMLSMRVINAAKEGLFHIWSVSHINEGIEILTNQSIRGDKITKEQTNDASFNSDAINDKVQERLKKMAIAMKNFKS